MILVDSNVLAAVLIRRDNHHQHANDLVNSVHDDLFHDDLLVSPLVIDEVAHLLTNRNAAGTPRPHCWPPSTTTAYRLPS